MVIWLLFLSGNAWRAGQRCALQQQSTSSTPRLLALYGSPVTASLPLSPAYHGADAEPPPVLGAPRYCGPRPARARSSGCDRSVPRARTDRFRKVVRGRAPLGSLPASSTEPTDHRASELLIAIPSEYRAAASVPDPAPLPFKTSTPSSVAAREAFPGFPAPPARRRPRVSLGDHILPAAFDVEPAAAWGTPGPSSARSGNGGSSPAEADLDAMEADVFELARTYLDSKELERCAKALAGCRSKKAKFLRLYATYLVREDVV